MPGFVLRARPTGAHSWRVQLPNRTWLSLGRVDEVTLADAREAAQTCRAKAALGEVLPKTKRSSNVSLRKFIDERYEPWMRATYGDRTRQAVRVRAVFSDFMDQPLSEITTARIDRWRSQRLRRSRRGTVPATAPRVAGATMNRDLAALQAALSRAVEWGYLTTNPVKRMKRSTEDERAIVRYLSDWTTVIVFGRFKELAAARGDAVDRAYELLRDRREWWLPAAAKTAISERYVPIAYRIRIDSMSGRRAAR